MHAHIPRHTTRRAPHPPLSKPLFPVHLTSAAWSMMAASWEAIGVMPIPPQQNTTTGEDLTRIEVRPYGPSTSTRAPGATDAIWSAKQGGEEGLGLTMGVSACVHVCAEGEREEKK